MRKKEAARIPVMEQLQVKKLTQQEAATMLGLSIRQIKRLVKHYKTQGVAGLIHSGRGKPSKRRITDATLDRAISIIKQRYADFGPTFAHEKLVEHHGINFGVETLRQAMIATGVWKVKKKKLVQLHPLRERRACVGELVQLDGSYHAWFEDRAPKCTLIVFIDDATSKLMDGLFAPYEGTLPLFEATEHYLLSHGKPLALYVDRHSTYKVNRQATMDEELKDIPAQSQFGRAMEELLISLIFALSSQAKGRVERANETLQDRLVKELRLEGISDPDEATKYFREVYIPKHNAKFAVWPKNQTNMHRPLLASDDLKQIFILQSQRVVTRNQVVQYRSKTYVLSQRTGVTTVIPGRLVTVLEDRFGEVVLQYKGKVLPYTIGVAPKAKAEPLVVGRKDLAQRTVVIPASNHPWRQRIL